MKINKGDSIVIECIKVTKSGKWIKCKKGNESKLVVNKVVTGKPRSYW